MARLIDADALIESIKHGLWDWETVNGIESRTVLEQTIQDIRNEPTIDAEPVRHGRWKYVNAYKGAEFGFYQCSVCGDAWWFTMKYCANCGAKMDGGMPF